MRSYLIKSLLLATLFIIFVIVDRALFQWEPWAGFIGFFFIILGIIYFPYEKFFNKK
ncbi:hypothetical protein ACQ1Q1_09315 [Ornithobacterium rhinotracheale]|uniref:hypothetical protein n=1 Tax=Ornithobacterium rhinotracheale TaxID=28251 RepID=UPI001FF2971D|nr:hypothetical protein [Ornithobacterium rhinotracheale]MCK0203357.1 hypothetical protein [Ornithobacterium rhinotracheale]